MNIPKVILVDHPYSGGGGELYVVGQGGLEFSTKRLFWICGVPKDWPERGNHAHRTCDQLFVPMQGSFVMDVTEGRDFHRWRWTGRPGKALLVPRMNWVKLYDFTPGSVCAVLCSEEYREDSYICDWEEFKRTAGSLQPDHQKHP